MTTGLKNLKKRIRMERTYPTELGHPLPEQITDRRWCKLLAQPKPLVCGRSVVVSEYSIPKFSKVSPHMEEVKHDPVSEMIRSGTPNRRTISSITNFLATWVDVSDSALIITNLVK